MSTTGNTRAAAAGTRLRPRARRPPGYAPTSRQIKSATPPVRAQPDPPCCLIQASTAASRLASPCAPKLDLTRSEVSAVATFYESVPPPSTGQYHVGVCTSALCAVMGGDDLAGRECCGWANDETSEDGRVKAWARGCKHHACATPRRHGQLEFFDNRAPDSAVELVTAWARHEWRRLTPAWLCTDLPPGGTSLLAGSE